MRTTESRSQEIIHWLASELQCRRIVLLGVENAAPYISEIERYGQPADHGQNEDQCVSLSRKYQESEPKKHHRDNNAADLSIDFNWSLPGQRECDKGRRRRKCGGRNKRHHEVAESLHTRMRVLKDGSKLDEELEGEYVSQNCSQWQDYDRISDSRGKAGCGHCDSIIRREPTAELQRIRQDL